MANINLSDHQLVYVQRKKCKMPTKKSSYRNYDANLFKGELIEQDWMEYYANEDPNILWEIMVSKINAVADMMCPVKTFNIKKYKDPWIKP